MNSDYFLTHAVIVPSCVFTTLSQTDHSTPVVSSVSAYVMWQFGVVRYSPCESDWDSAGKIKVVTTELR